MVILVKNESKLGRNRENFDFDRREIDAKGLIKT